MKRFERSNGLDTALYKNYLYIYFAKFVICDGPRGFLNATMDRAFKLMVRLSLCLGKRFLTRYMTDVFE